MSVEWNRKNVVSTSRYTIRIYKGDMVCFIYYKTDLFKRHIWSLIKDVLGYLYIRDEVVIM